MRKLKHIEQSNIKLLTKCPVCGGRIKIDVLYQFSNVYNLTRSGKASARHKKDPATPMDCHALYCENMDFQTDYELAVITPQNPEYRVIQNGDRYFLQYK